MKEESEKKLKKVNYLTPILTFSIGLVVLIAVGIWLGLAIDKKVEKIGWQRAHIKALESREDSYRQLQEDFEEIEDKYALIDRSVPGKDDFVGLVVRLESLARKNKVDLQIDFPEEIEATGNSLDFTLKVSGKLKNVLQYLKVVKSEPYLIKVVNLKLERVNSQSRVGGEISINVQLDETFHPSQISQ